MATKTKKNQQSGGGLSAGRGRNYGKGGTRRGGQRVRGEDVTRPTAQGMPGNQQYGGAQIGGRRPTSKRRGVMPDAGGNKSNRPLQASPRDEERPSTATRDPELDVDIPEDMGLTG